jgi:hypothetical protein
LIIDGYRLTADIQIVYYNRLNYRISATAAYEPSGCLLKTVTHLLRSVVTACVARSVMVEMPALSMARGDLARRRDIDAVCPDGD